MRNIKKKKMRSRGIIHRLMLLTIHNCFVLEYLASVAPLPYRLLCSFCHYSSSPMSSLSYYCLRACDCWCRSTWSFCFVFIIYSDENYVWFDCAIRLHSGERHGWRTSGKQDVSQYFCVNEYFVLMLCCILLASFRPVDARVNASLVPFYRF